MFRGSKEASAVQTKYIENSSSPLSFLNTNIASDVHVNFSYFHSKFFALIINSFRLSDFPHSLHELHGYSKGINKSLAGKVKT